MNSKPDYEGFCEHVEEWNGRGIPWGTSDLINLAEKYNTPIPSFVLNKIKKRNDQKCQ